jgi:hypothetical protein
MNRGAELAALARTRTALTCIAIGFGALAGVFLLGYLVDIEEVDGNPLIVLVLAALALALGSIAFGLARLSPHPNGPFPPWLGRLCTVAFLAPCAVFLMQVAGLFTGLDPGWLVGVFAVSLALLAGGGAAFAFQRGQRAAVAPFVLALVALVVSLVAAEPFDFAARGAFPVALALGVGLCARSLRDQRA